MEQAEDEEQAWSSAGSNDVQLMQRVACLLWLVGRQAQGGTQLAVPCS